MTTLPERHSWVRLLPPERVHVPQEDGTTKILDATGDLIPRLVEQTKALLAEYDRVTPPGSTPYRPAVLSEHTPDGARRGWIRDVKAVDGVLYALTEWTKAAWAQVQAEEVTHVSAGIEWTHTTHSGATFGPILREFSVTATPVVTSIGTIQDTLGVQLSRPPLTPPEDIMTPEQVQEFMEALASMQEAHAALVERLDALEAAQMAYDTSKDEEEPVEMADEPDMTPPNAGSPDADQLAAKITSAVVAQLSARLGKLNLAAPPASGRATTQPRSKEQLRDQLKAQGLKGNALADRFQAEVTRLGL